MKRSSRANGTLRTALGGWGPRRGFALGLALLLGVSACGKKPDDEECGRLLDRYVELLARGDRPSAGGAELARLQSDARHKAARDPAFAECKSRVSRREFECAMQAENADRFEICFM